MALLEDQIEETQAALIAADQAGDAEAARHLADHLRGLEEQHAAVLKAQQESSQSEGSYRNPMITAGVGAIAGAIANPLRNEVSALVAKPAPVPEMKMPHPSQIMPGATHGGQDWTKALTGVDVPGAQMNKQSLDTAQRMASTVARGGELAGGSITPGGILLGPELGAKPPAPAPMIPRNVAQAKEKGMNLLQSLVGEHQPSRPFDIVKGGAKGSIAGAALGDVPQQVMQGNVGTAAADVGLGGGTIAHGLARTPKGKALAGLIALGSGATRVGQGINELTAPVEQKAGGGLIGNMASQAAINAPFMLPEMANIGKNVTRGAYAPAMENAASLGLALAPINPLTAGLSLMAPGEAGRGSTVDEWNARKAAEEAARQRAIKKLQYEQFMQQQVGANAPQLLENYLVQQATQKAQGGDVKKPEGYAPGGRVGALTELLNLVRNRGGSEAAKRLERAADLVPNLENKFQTDALKSAFTGDNASAVMVMRPQDFKKYATPLPEIHTEFGNFNIADKGAKGDYQEYLDYLGRVSKQGGLEDVPYLQLNLEQNRMFPNVAGHEGRNRSEALAKLGDQTSLVRMMPRANLREAFPRRSQEEYLEALINKIGNKPMVTPQPDFDPVKGIDIPRGLIELPEMFKKGGSV